MTALNSSSIDWSFLKNKSVLITGATGMLASYFAFALIYLNRHYGFNIQVILLARSKGNVERVFGGFLKGIDVIIQDVSVELQYEGHVDYILHAAGAASPYYIINDPVGIIKANTLGTFNVLELASRSNTQKVIFASTREVYGKVENKEVIVESDMGVIDPLEPRSCYPESKRISETILKSYSLQHKVPFNTLRIAHTYGPGMQIKNDGRVMADFINSAVENQDTQLNSSGTDERAFCYITDAIEAMFRVLQSGIDGEAYNIANETEPIKIVELAELVHEVAESGKKVFAGKNNGPLAGYTNYKRVRLSTSKIEALGWKPKVSLKEGLVKTLSAIEK